MTHDYDGQGRQGNVEVQLCHETLGETNGKLYLSTCVVYEMYNTLASIMIVSLLILYYVLGGWGTKVWLFVKPKVHQLLPLLYK